MKRLSSISVLAAAAFLLLGACKEANIADGTGGTTTTTTTGNGGGNACIEAGGVCGAVTATFCQDGILGDAAQYPCGPGVGVACCFPPVPPDDACTAAGGVCGAVTATLCQDGILGDAAQYPCGTGVGMACCLPVPLCADSCKTIGETRCFGSMMQVCDFDPSTYCGPVWTAQAPCPPGASCNSDGTKCVAPVTTCTQPSDCGCWCTCTDEGTCGYCTGAIPESCTTSKECGPTCAGLACFAGKCVHQVCMPGMNQTCNDLIQMSAIAGICNADGSCTCVPPYTKQPSGRCG